MILKPGEAKFKFCPLLKTSDDKLKFCQGPQCVMWRLVDESQGEDSTGYCGLAGVPLTLRQA